MVHRVFTDLPFLPINCLPAIDLASVSDELIEISLWSSARENLVVHVVSERFLIDYLELPVVWVNDITQTYT